MTPERNVSNSAPPGNAVLAQRLELADLKSPRPLALVGKRIGRYVLRSLLANGTTAQVWLAKPKDDETCLVALKVLALELGGTNESLRRFSEQAMVAALATRHPNICELREVGSERGLVFAALEWVPGVSLESLMHVDGGVVSMDDTVAARIVADTCSGLDAAHEAVGDDGQPSGIRQAICAEHVLISRYGDVKINGLWYTRAATLAAARRGNANPKGQRARPLLGCRADQGDHVAAMGRLLYFLTLGKHPSETEPNALPNATATRPGYRLPHEVRPGNPPELEAIVVRSLSTDSTTALGSIASVAALHEALERWLVTAGRPTTSEDIVPTFRARLAPAALAALDEAVSALPAPAPMLPRSSHFAERYFSAGVQPFEQSRGFGDAPNFQ